MAFQDNSGDIIFDVCLTDEGRRRLAKGDGSFKITHFALSDEEVNYSLFVNNTGSAYQDLQILQTPVLEAFTNNTSTMKTKLITITENNTLYLPILKLNENQGNTGMHGSGSFMVAVDRNTEDNNGDYATTKTAIGIGSDGQKVSGIIFGEQIKDKSTVIRVDAGLDTTALPPSSQIPAHSTETQYLIEIDNRLGFVVNAEGTIERSPDTIDDDNIAIYSFSAATEGTNPVFVFNNGVTTTSAGQAIRGPRSTFISFKIASSSNLRHSNYLFDLLGSTTTMLNYNGVLQNVKYIDSIVKVTGYTTGYSVDIPIRYVKLSS